MTISEVCIRRPVFTWVLVAMPVVLGMASYGRLGVDLFPNVDFPVCSVTTVLPGASVEEVETSVTKPIEDIINTISGIEELRSTTMEGVSVVTVQFLLSKNSDVGAQEVRDKISTILANLPEGTESPIVDKFESDAMPVLTIAVSGKRDFREVTEIARKQIKERLQEIREGGLIPPDISTELIRDQSRFIKKSIEEVKFHLLLAGVLVSATILLFIRDWRTTLIATLAIPTSIIPTFAFMDYMGFTLNNITMLGLILAIGIVIDDGVVVHENIFRHMEEDGMDGMTAARVGTREIALPVLATSLSLIVIFVPLAYMGGIVGRFFSSFGLTVAFAILMSLFVSFTLTPMLCSRFLKLEHNATGHARSKSGRIYRIIDRSYGGILWLALRVKLLVVLL